MMSACVVAIGSELLRGNTVDTNSAWLAGRLLDLGFEAGRITILPDEASEIGRSLTRLMGEFSVLVVTGGLGPTNDDLTRDGAADAFHAPLELRPDVVDDIRRRFVAMGLDMPPQNRRQAEIPRGATVLPNPHGTACGFALRRGDKLAFFMPGVPREMEAMFDASVAPELDALPQDGGRTFVARRSLRCTGVGESSLEAMLGELSDPGANPSLGLSCSPGLITLYLVGRGASAGEAAALVDGLVARCTERVGHLIVGGEGETPAGAVARELRERRLRLALIDAATGGHLVASLTEALGPDGAACLAGAEVLPGSLVAGQWGDELRERAATARAERSADCVLALAWPGGPAAATLVLADDRGLSLVDLPSLGGRAEPRQRLTQTALAALWRHLTGMGPSA